MEHFRYTIIASQLLADSSNHRLSIPPPAVPNLPPSSTLSTLPLGPGGILLAALAASPILYIIRSIRSHWSEGISWLAITLLCCATGVVATLLYAYARRQWLQSLRRQAVDAASAFVVAIQDFESSAASLLTFIQEVELVSRGYRLYVAQPHDALHCIDFSSRSSPLPPVSRLEGTGQNRTCARMRRTLQSVYSTVSPNLISASTDLEPHIHLADFDRFLEVYDVRKDDIEDARIGFVDVAQEELESLRSLRLYQYRIATLRRLLLCSLLSIPATGRQSDAQRWRVAVAVMEYLTQLLVDSNDILCKLLKDEQQLSKRSSAVSKPRSTSSRPASVSTSPSLSQAIRPISSLTTGVHTLSARLHLLRNSVSSLSQLNESSVPPMSTSDLQEQYDALGEDLKALMHEWEQGRPLLNEEFSKQNRRASSMSLRRTNSGLGIVVEDDNEDPIDPNVARANALKALTGEGVKRSSVLLPLHLPLSPPISNVDPLSENSTPAEEREAVFEGMAVPRVRQRSSLSGMTREERIKRMQEEQQKLSEARKSREAKGDMMSELKTVIGQRRPLTFRVPSQEEQQKLEEKRRTRDSKEFQGDMMNELKTAMGQRRPLSFSMRPQRESTRVTSA